MTLVRIGVLVGLRRGGEEKREGRTGSGEVSRKKKR